jgi:hypothetical protein
MGGAGGAGGLLGGVFGGGGLLGMVGGLVGTMFGGPIGGMIGSAIGNTLQDAVGDATNQAARQLHKEDGMPKFLVDEIEDVVHDAVQGLKDKNVDPATEDSVKREHGDKFEAFTKELTKTIVDAVRNEMKNGDGGCVEEGRGGRRGRSSGGSWMQAIAKAMGEVMGNKAKRMVELSKEIADKTASAGKGQSEGDKAQAAAETQKLNTEFQATGQEFNLLQTTFSTAIKTIGEGMASVARKQ